MISHTDCSDMHRVSVSVLGIKSSSGIFHLHVKQRSATRIVMEHTAATIGINTVYMTCKGSTAKQSV